MTELKKIVYHDYELKALFPWGYLPSISGLPIWHSPISIQDKTWYQGKNMEVSW